MEFTPSRPHPERENNPHPSPIPSPHSNGSCSSNGHPPPPPPPHHHHPTPPLTPTPKPISRSHETNLCPTTFVQADTTSFKHVVQMLTGSSDATAKPPSSRAGIPPIKSSSAQKKHGGFKLYERRNSLKNASLMIETLPASPRKHEILSPSILDFPALVLSPVTPVNEDTLRKASSAAEVEEEKAIAEKKFYFHPSPRAERDGEPRLLPLFPVTSPRVSGSSS